MTAPKIETKSTRWLSLIFLFIAVILLWGSSWVAIVYSPLDGWQQRGTFGDMFGGINALFSGLAFGGVIYAILLQRQELELQREELKSTRSEMEKSVKAQLRSSASFEQQVRLMAITAYISAETELMRGLGRDTIGRSHSEETILRLQKELKNLIGQELF